MSSTIKPDSNAGAAVPFNPLGAGGWELPHIDSGNKLPLARTKSSSIQSFEDYLADLIPRANDTTTHAQSRARPPINASERVSAKGGVAGLLDRIAQGEGTSGVNVSSNGYDSDYDVTLGYGAYDPPASKPISQMTLAEVKAFQQGMLSHPANKWNSSAVGRYQIVGKTLRTIQGEMGLPDNTRFDQKTQDAMAMHLLNKNGLDSWQAGKMSDHAFQANLATEWASIADPSTGQSHYQQRTGTSTAQIQDALQGIKTPDSLIAQNLLDLRGPKVNALASNGTSAYSYWKDVLGD